MEKVTEKITQEALTPTENFLVRGKNKSWFWIDNAILDHFGHLIGPYGLSVYMTLSRFANNGDQSTFVSQSTIARLTGMSRMEVSRTWKLLEHYHLIQVERRKGQTSLVTIGNPLQEEPGTVSPKGCNSQLQGVQTTVTGGATHSYTNKTILTNLSEQKDDFHQKVMDFEKDQAPPPEGVFKKLKTPLMV